MNGFCKKKQEKNKLVLILNPILSMYLLFYYYIAKYYYCYTGLYYSKHALSNKAIAKNKSNNFIGIA